MKKLQIFVAASLAVGAACSSDPKSLPSDATVGVSDASTGACPSSIVVDPAHIDRRANANDPAPSPTFGGNGYAMAVQPSNGNWDGHKVAEHLTTGAAGDWYMSKLPANLKNVPICPFNGGFDAAKAGACGVKASVFNVGDPGVPPAAQPGIANHFWDSHFAHYAFDIVAKAQLVVPNMGERCLVLCSQYYECNGTGGSRLPLDFGTVLDFQHVLNANPVRTDVFAYKIDSAGGVN